MNKGNKDFSFFFMLNKLDLYEPTHAFEDHVLTNRAQKAAHWIFSDFQKFWSDGNTKCSKIKLNTQAEIP